MLSQVTEQRQSVGIVIPYLVASDIAEAGSSRQRIKASGHSAVTGDLIRLTSAGHVNCEALVVSVETNYINLNQLFPLSLNAGDTFDILRFAYLSSSNGTLPVTIAITEVGFLPAMEIAAGSIHAAYESKYGLDAVRYISMDNGTDEPVCVSFDEGDTTHVIIRSLSSYTVNFGAIAANGMCAYTAIYIKYQSSPCTTGSFVITALQ